MDIREAVAGYRSRLVIGEGKQAAPPGFDWVLDELVSVLGDMRADKVSASQLRNFMAEVEWEHHYNQDKRPSRSERDGIRVALLDFFRWASVETAISCPDTVEIVDGYGYDTSIPFTMDEVEALVAACSTTKIDGAVDRGNAVRNQAVLLVLLDTGMHPAQLCRLRVRDFLCREGELVLPRAGARHGYRTRLGQTTRKVLTRHLILRGMPGWDEPLTSGVGGKALQVQDIDRVFGQLGELAGVKDPDPHRLRRTFANEYVRQGGDVYSLQDILGCPNLRSVLWELELSDADVAGEHRKANPGDRLG